MYFWYDYIKPKYQNNAKLCYMDTDDVIIHIKSEDFMKILQMVLKKDLIHQIMNLKTIAYRKKEQSDWINET